MQSIRKLRRVDVQFLITVFLVTLVWTVQFSTVDVRATVLDYNPTAVAVDLATYGVAVNPSTNMIYVANGWRDAGTSMAKS